MTGQFDQWIQDLASADKLQNPRGEVAFASETALKAKEQLIAAGKAAVPAIMACLGGRGPAHQRAMAAEVLGELGDIRAVNILIEKLNDPEMLVRGSSAVALGKIGDRRAIPALRQLAGHSEEVDQVKAFAKGALDQMGASVAAAAQERTKKERGPFRKLIYTTGLIMLLVSCLMISLLVFSLISEPDTVVNWSETIGCSAPALILGGLLMFLGSRPGKANKKSKKKEVEKTK